MSTQPGVLIEGALIESHGDRGRQNRALDVDLQSTNYSGFVAERHALELWFGDARRIDRARSGHASVTNMQAVVVPVRR